MEYYQNRLCVTGAELMEFMPKGTIDSKVSRGKITRLRRACYDTTALYTLDSMPTNIKVEFYRKNPDLEEQAKARPLLENIEPDGAALEYYESYTLPDGRYLTRDHQEEYSNNAAILNACKRVIDDSNSHRMRQSPSQRLKKGEFWGKVATALPRISEEMPHSLPLNPTRLQEKFNQYQKGGYEILISGKFLNKNSAKVDDDVKESVIIQLIGDRRNLDNAQVMKIYNIMAEQMNWHKITSHTVGNWREKYDIITAAGRLGETQYRAKKTMQVKRSRPTAPLLYWTADGWDVELLYQQQVTNKKGHSVTTYHNRLTVVIILDPCVNYPIGYAIGEAESPALISAALRNAVNHTAELFGTRYRVNQFQCDNYAIKNLKPLYGQISDKVTPARVRNAKSKVVEPYFNSINKKYCQFQPNWSGFGITSRKDKQPNNDAINKYRHSFPDKEGCAAQIDAIIYAERAEKQEQYLKLFEHLPEERKLPLPTEQYLLNFGEETGRTNTLEGNGLRPTIGGIKRDYDCFDLNFRKYSHLKWRVMYDPDDLNKVLAVNEDGSLRFMLEEKHIQPMAIAERTENDVKELARIREYNKRLESKVSNRLLEAAETTQQLLDANINQIDPTLAKLVICDSRGQHKNQRNKKRIPETTTYEEIETITDDSNLSDLY